MQVTNQSLIPMDKPCVVLWDHKVVMLCDNIEHAKTRAALALGLSSSLNIFYYDHIPEEIIGLGYNFI